MEAKIPRSAPRGSRIAPAALAMALLLGAVWILGQLTQPASAASRSPQENGPGGRIYLPAIGAQPPASESQTKPGTPTQTPRPTKTPRGATSTPTATRTSTATLPPTATPSATPPPTATPTTTLLPTATATTGAPLTTSHAGRFTTYEGSKTCVRCHLDDAKEVHGALHYQWNAPAPYSSGPATAGKLGALNDFCGYPDINWLSVLTNLDGQPTDGGCATCHAGWGAKPIKDQTQAQLENIDCLICHSDNYRRKVVSENGVAKFAVAPERMTVPVLQAITDIKRPGKATCLGCHVNSGGGANNKRGDLEPAHYDPTREFDVHMASTAKGGAGLDCVDCHVTQDHHIAGRGSDMRGTDLDVAVRCVNCHPATPHSEYNLDLHTSKVECSVCHIPQFARITTTDMFRDFRSVEVLQSRRLYEPKMERQGNVVPRYTWFNGRSDFYEFGESAVPGPSGRVVMSNPLGSINDPAAKLFPFKYHQAMQAHDPVTGRILPMKMGLLFQTGNVDQAILQGVAGVGWTLPQGYDFVPTERWMTINHEVAPAESALTCSNCHAATATRMNWDTLGYTPKTVRNGRPLCASCHSDKSGEWPTDFFYKVHDKHVKDKKLACAECHTFTR